MKKHLFSLAFLITFSFAVSASLQAAEDPRSIHEKNAQLIEARKQRQAEYRAERQRMARELAQDAERQAIQSELDQKLNETEAYLNNLPNAQKN